MAKEWPYQTRFADHTQFIPLAIMLGESFTDTFPRAGFTENSRLSPPGRSSQGGSLPFNDRLLQP
jgi:hypothetical protein